MNINVDKNIEKQFTQSNTILHFTDSPHSDGYVYRVNDLYYAKKSDFWLYTSWLIGDYATFIEWRKNKGI